MRHISLSSLILLCCLSLALLGCDVIPEEGTIVYDVDFPRADSDEAQGGSGSGSGTGGGGGGGGTTGSGSGSGGYDPDNSSIGYTITESGGSTDVVEGATDTFDIVLNSAPTDNITITVTTPNTGDVLVSSTGGTLSPDNTTLTLTFTPANWNTPQSVTVTGVEDATDEGGGTTAVNLTVSLTASLDTDWVPADIPDSTITANLTDSQATGPPSQITNLAVTDNGTQTITLGWTAASGAANQTLYWSTTSPVTTSSDNFTLSGTATSYVHGGLTASTAYYYMIVPTNGLGSASPSNEVSGTPSGFTGCTTSGTLSDPDADLLVHYDFNNNLNDVKNANGDGRYNLTNTGGTIKFAQGCGYGNAAYFDPSTGYAYNDNFVDDNESALSGNFTVTMWINGDADNTQYSAVYSTGNKRSKNHQIDVDSAGTPQIRLLVYNDVNIEDPAPITNGQWYHVAVTHNTSNQWEVFKNGVSVGTGTSGAAATWEQLKIGINRNTENHWKGYIDEFKVFGRAFDGDEVKNACLLYGQCDNLTAPATPDNLTATNVGDGTSVNVSWNAVNGVDNYTVYWTSTPGVEIDPNNASTYDNFTTVTAPTTSATATGLTPGGNYDFTVVATNSSGSSNPATEVNLSTNPSVPTGLTATSPDNSTINLSWNASTGADNYTVYWTTNTGTAINPSDNNTYTGSITVSGTNHSMTSLPAGSNYDFVVVATNSGGNSNPTAEVNGETAPPAPTGLAATDPGNGTDINLTWNAVTGADNYTVYWTSNPATPIDPSNPATYDGSTTVTGTSTTATGLTNGTNYDFTIIATNTAGNSSPATEVNATPTLVLPAAIDNATAYHGFTPSYGTVYGKTYNFNPSYYITWNHHPDKASGSLDRYYIYISDNVSVPIDPNDNTTYIAVRMALPDYNYTQILTALSVYPENDPNFLVGIPPRFGVVFYDSSKGVYSPISNQVTPPLASEALREIGDLRINSGYFSADNSTLSSFDRTTAIKIVHKDKINVGERFIMDGAFLSSDVIPQMANSSGYDYLRLNFFNPAQIFANGRIETDGAYFHYKKSTPAVQTNTISSNSFCGTNNSADCHFGMDIIADNSTGMVIKKGTLNNPTDYAVSNLADGSDGPTYFAPNGREHVTRTRTGSDPWEPLLVNVDNASYAGLDVYTNNGKTVTINLANADAAMSKVAIPITPPTNLAGTTPANTQQVNLTWTVSPESLLPFNHVIYWKKASGSPISIDPNDNTTYDGKITVDNTTNSYVHSGLDGATQYNYVIRAETAVGGVSTSEPSVNSYSIVTNSFITDTLNVDNDPSLLVYYDFNGTLNDQKDNYSDGRYNLIAANGATINYTDSHFASNQAAYFDASNGYAYNDNMSDDNESNLFASGNFTISLWFYADDDMPNFSSLMSSRYVPDTGNDSGNWSWQLDSDNGKLRWRSAVGDTNTKEHTTASNNYPTNIWSHAAFVKYDNGTSMIYMNGSHEVTSANTQETPLEVLKIGTNRREEFPWKGYIDEFKIYSRALDSTDVCDLFKNDGPLNDGATCP